jgi:protein-S-isoprenylcysteine O-methyltransferase Ste14
MSNGSGAQFSSQASGVRIFPPAVYIAGLVIGYLIEWLWPVPILPGPFGFVLRILGVAIILAGAGLIASAITRFRSIGTPVNPTEPTTTLAFDGPYRFTRNPMYLGLALLLAGFALVGDTLWPLLAVIPAVWIIQTQVIAREEPYLEAKFGAPYRDFTARVRRWL